MAIARRLGEHGFAVVGWDVDAERVTEAAVYGVFTGANPADVSARSEVVLTMVTDDAAARWIFGSPSGILAGDVGGKLFVEMSTLRPATVRSIAAELEPHGARLVGAPVLGSIPRVRDGKLLVLAGGRFEDIDRARPVLDVLARSVVHLGPIGAGNAMKLIVNLTMGAYLQALAEGLALGECQGLGLDSMLEVLGQASTANGWLAAKIPVLRGGEAETTLDINALRKDIMSAVATGATSGIPMPLADGILGSLSAAVAAGEGRSDLAQMPRFYREAMVQASAAAL